LLHLRDLLGSLVDLGFEAILFLYVELILDSQLLHAFVLCFLEFVDPHVDWIRELVLVDERSAAVSCYQVRLEAALLHHHDVLLTL